MPASQRLPSANSGEPTGAITPADALGESKRMSQSVAEMKESNECPVCGEPFDTERGMKIHHARIHGESIAGREYECEWCEKTFRRDPAKARQYDHIYCSQECVNEARTELWKGAGHPMADSVTAMCDECGEQFRRCESKLAENSGTFCSRECFATSLENPESDRIDYGDNWQKQRDRALSRDGGECQVCGHAGTERILDVHHIQPVRTFDTPEGANTLNNLITLCRSCHHRWEGIPLRPERV